MKMHNANKKLQLETLGGGQLSVDEMDTIAKMVASLIFRKFEEEIREPESRNT